MTGARTSVILLLFTCVAFGMIAPNLFALAQALAGADASGRWVGIQVSIGNVPGLIAPFLTGILVDHTGSFIVPFVVAGVLQLAGAAAWLFGVGPVAPIDWQGHGRGSGSPPAISPRPLG
jgi:cyanate permease